MYEEIKRNIIERFLNTYYLWTCCTTKESILIDMKNRIPFNVRYVYFSDYEILEMNLGDNVIITFNLKWESRTHGNEIYSYRLISIT